MLAARNVAEHRETPRENWTIAPRAWRATAAQPVPPPHQPLFRSSGEISSPESFQEDPPGEDLDPGIDCSGFLRKAHEHRALDSMALAQGAQASQVAFVHPRRALHLDRRIHLS